MIKLDHIYILIIGIFLLLLLHSLVYHKSSISEINNIKINPQIQEEEL